jgi:hypothetical protein
MTESSKCVAPVATGEPCNGDTLNKSDDSHCSHWSWGPVSDLSSLVRTNEVSQCGALPTRRLALRSICKGSAKATCHEWQRAIFRKPMECSESRAGHGSLQSEPQSPETGLDFWPLAPCLIFWRHYLTSFNNHHKPIIHIVHETVIASATCCDLVSAKRQ